MLLRAVWSRLAGGAGAVIEDVGELGVAGVVLRVRPKSRERSRCGICGRRSPGYDQGEGRRHWRTLNMGTTWTYLEAEAPRVVCPKHGVVVARVPWARHRSPFTRAFEDSVAVLATQMSKKSISELMGIAWTTVGGIITRVAEEQLRVHRNRLNGLARIGIDEISYQRGQRYLIVVVDHDSGALIWARPGRDAKTLGQFFEHIGEQRCKAIELVSADGAGWIEKAVRKHCPNAQICLDPFHVVKRATDALDEVRRELWNQARQGGDRQLATMIKGARYALWKNLDELTPGQAASLAHIVHFNDRLHRSWFLKEELRLVFRVDSVDKAMALLQHWLGWARRCRIKPFVKLARTITAYLPRLQATLTYRLSNARVEAVNTKLRLIMRRSFGFHSPEPLIALGLLSLGGLCPPLPAQHTPSGITHG